MLNEKKPLTGFTLIELLIVIAIIGILSLTMIVSVRKAVTLANQRRSIAEIRALAIALRMYSVDNGQYPEDSNRGFPNGLEEYLSSSPDWPDSPFPSGEYDWDNWGPENLSYEPDGHVYQISIRFCPLGEPNNCVFPDQPWAENFDYYSSAYYCVEGPCRAHGAKNIDHPGCCLGGECPDYAEKCTF